MKVFLHQNSKATFIFAILTICWTSLMGQQQGDGSFNPSIENPVYEQSKGPVVVIDEAHNNFHTREGRFKPFTNVLKNDGYQVKSNTNTFSSTGLSDITILVVANAIHESNLRNWTLPTPSAFTKDEITALNQWVKDGGSLFLIADHMPFPGAAEDLAKSFGFTFFNGFAINTKKNKDFFSTKNGDLKESILTKGRTLDKNVTDIRSFTGQGFKAPESATPVLVLDEKYENRMPQTAWQFEENSTTTSANGLLQGAYMNYGKGRLVVFGEAAMFTAQTNGNRKFGLSAPDASQNIQLLLNILHWLDHTLE